MSPVYNQIHEFPQVLDELKAHPPPCDEILLVNNGSNDGSELLVRKSGYKYLDLPRNYGVGYSLIKAAEWALEHDFDIYGGFASNGKMLPAEMGRVLEPLLRGEADYVTGSRFMQGGDSPNLPSFRRNAIPMVNVFVQLVTGALMTDATCGYRAYKLDILRKARFNWRASWLYTYSFEYYLYAEDVLEKRWRWMEVPITMRYPQQGQRYSKIRPGVDWWAMLRPWLAARLLRKGFSL